MRIFGLSLSALWIFVGGCGRSDVSGEVDAFCDALADAPDCESSSECADEFEQGMVEFSKCDRLYGQFAECLSSLDLSCVDGPDFEVHAMGDGSDYEEYIDVLSTYLFYVHDTECRDVGVELASCTTCSQAPGYPGGEGQGVGDRCGDDGKCADGLECRHGMCTRECSGINECLGTNVSPDSCDNEFGQENLCEEGWCTSVSHVDNDFCQAYGEGWEEGGYGLYCRHD